MESSFLNNKAKYLTLIQAAQRLSVPMNILLEWNDLNILKPTITQRGQIVYTQEQIDKFLEAQKILMNNKEEVENSEFDITQELGIHEQSYNPLSSTPMSISRGRVFISYLSDLSKNRVFPVGLAVIISVIMVTLLSINNLKSSKTNVVAQNTKAAVQTPDESSKISTSQNDNSAFTESTPLSAQVKDTNADLTNKENKSVNLAYTHLGQGQILGTKTDVNGPMVSPRIDNIGYSEIAKLSGNNDNPNNMFDDAGNIKGDAPNPDVLGMATGISKLIHVDNTLPSQNSEYIFMLMIVIAVSTVILLKRLPAYSYRAQNGESHRGPVSRGDKVFEIDQKTDGTVVLYFKGNEYKLSKPELDSESDQFIERLMEVSESDQEIDYDKSTDENIRLSTPLSKLVTRLGFVGTKRDLFFPRTSKNKVLFRRYITEEDLTAMNMNASELFKEFTAKSS